MELVNQINGEILEVAEHLEAARVIEREIGKLDRAIAAARDEAKELKTEREKKVKELRGIVRDYEPLEAHRPSPRRRRRGRK